MVDTLRYKDWIEKAENEKLIIEYLRQYKSITNKVAREQIGLKETRIKFGCLEVDMSTKEKSVPPNESEHSASEN